MKRKFVFFVVFLLIAGTLLVSAQTEKKYVLKFNHVLTTQDPYHEAFLKWAEAVSARTNGNLKVEIFPSAQLGVEEDILEQIRQGANGFYVWVHEEIQITENGTTTEKQYNWIYYLEPVDGQMKIVNYYHF